MKASEKAESIIKKYISICNSWNEEWVNGKTITELKKSSFQREWFDPKICALVCVDEIINSNPHSNPLNTNPVYSTMDYWQEVKSEIEKM